MDAARYLFTVNKSRGGKLNHDELKDVQQESEIILSQKNYNDQLVRLTILSSYRQAVKKKIKQEQIAAEQSYFNSAFVDDGPSDLEIQTDRETKIASLKVSLVQKKIIKLLVQGNRYEEIQKKLRITSKQLRDHGYNIKKQNAGH